MVFCSLSFLCLFLPLTVAFYFVCRSRPWRNAVLLIASLLFYTWGEPKYVLLMLAATVVAYLGGLLMARAEGGRKKAVFIVTLCLLTANLLIFKYLNFFSDNLFALFGKDSPLAAIALPIGISFYTFQILSYVIDLYRGQIGVQKNFFYLLLYVSFFPQLIAGPIVRYVTVETAIRTRKESWDDAYCGMTRFIRGLAKKVLIANLVASVSESIYAGDPAVYGSAGYWIAAIAYALQIYFDFSGYSDMAIGLGRIFGFQFLENFDYPYISKSITEFWRRWHISLSTWFRDYIYIPLGGSRTTKGKWIRNILIVWALTGFWHGAQWNFLCWGLYYALLLLAEKFSKPLLDKLPGAVRWLGTMILVVLGWVIFSQTDFSKLLAALGQMFAFRPTDWAGALAADSSLLYAPIVLPIGIFFSFPVFRRLLQKDASAGATVLSCVIHGVLLLACILFIISSSYNPFIYFRF